MFSAVSLVVDIREHLSIMTSLWREICVKETNHDIRSSTGSLKQCARALKVSKITRIVVNFQRFEFSVDYYANNRRFSTNVELSLLPRMRKTTGQKTDIKSNWQIFHAKKQNLLFCKKNKTRFTRNILNFTASRSIRVAEKSRAKNSANKVITCAYVLWQLSTVFFIVYFFVGLVY